MAERRKPGFLVPIGFYDSPQVLSIPKRLRAEAVGIWTLCGSYSANQLTDGYVSDEKLKILGCRPAVRAALLATRDADGSHDPLWISAESGGILIRKWSKWQRTHDEVRTYRALDAERKRTARAAVKSDLPAETQNRPQNVRADSVDCVRVESRDPKTETETETKTGLRTYHPHEGNARGKNGAEIARAEFARLPARSLDAYRIAQAFSASLPVPIEAGMLAGVGTQIDKCLKSGIPPPAIAAGLKAWTSSDSWSPTQIPNFVHKANNRGTNGKPTAKALGYDQALTELLTEVQTL